MTNYSFLAVKVLPNANQCCLHYFASLFLVVAIMDQVMSMKLLH